VSWPRRARTTGAVGLARTARAKIGSVARMEVSFIVVDEWKIVGEDAKMVVQGTSWCCEGALVSCGEIKGTTFGPFIVALYIALTEFTQGRM
jgi:hypothetical protein